MNKERNVGYKMHTELCRMLGNDVQEWQDWGSLLKEGAVVLGTKDMRCHEITGGPCGKGVEGLVVSLRNWEEAKCQEPRE
jgi:hypothetical protein